MTMKCFILSSFLALFTVINGFVLTRPFSIERRIELDQLKSSLNRLFLSSSGESPATPSAPPTVLNGKRVLPCKIILAGLKGQDDDNSNNKFAAVYAVLNSNYKRGSGDGWEATEYVGVSQDLAEALQSHLDGKGTDKVANVRALSFSFPQPNAMQDVAQQWRQLAKEAGVDLTKGSAQWEADVLDYLFDDDDDDDFDDDDEEEEDWSTEMTSDAMASVPPSIGTEEQSIVSPFENQQKSIAADDSDTATGTATTTEAAEEGELAFTVENVDKVLDEVRPYLISDGGNVAVKSVDDVERNVYLELEGACGSCPSSTVTMQMGIERVLKEKFSNLGQVLQVEDESQPQELTQEAVEMELSRLSQAITAMGGVCQLVSVDPTTGVVEIEFRGASKVQQGLELALLDVKYLNAVKFVMGDE